MDAEALKAIQEAVSQGTSGMVSWVGLVATVTPVAAGIAGAFKLLWNKYTAAREELEKYVKAQAVKAEGKATDERENALKWVEIRDKLAKQISDAWQERVNEWKGRYFEEQRETKVAVENMLSTLRTTLERLDQSIPAALNASTDAIEENDAALAAVAELLETVQAFGPKLDAIIKGLAATEHNYKNLKPILQKISEIVHRYERESDDGGRSN